MEKFPHSENALVVRTDFSDAAAWESLCQAIIKPVGDFQANVEFLSTEEFDGLTPEQCPAMVPPHWNHVFVFLADATTLSHPEHPILCVELSETPARAFRVIPSEMWSVENNLSLANMDWSDFADSVAADGIFRGFS